MIQKDAYLVDERYLQGDTSVENITSWFNFWKKLGVKHEITEILISSVIPKLHTLDLLMSLVCCFQIETNLRKKDMILINS